MTNAKIEFTKDAIVKLEGKENPVKVAKGKVMLADDLESKDFGSFANITKKEVSKEFEKKVETKKEDKKEDKKEELKK